ncbi:site-specific DNA-methyltransferase [Thiohalobacter sp. COW1]|uniref:site-specific DNA-methyltransferase n=1 Tax=Thiohalobacter sp. COW1 TaxID=2795687 RepID=UPI0019150857|nr:site-specific DNA-methyltransferase [Thiohalobacter sp. COW1]BCO32036.1 site-specific DNA-methyltransferase [Thiohalobacter sp. COW1]
MPYLNWLTRDDDLSSARKAPYRLLEAVPEHSAGDQNTQNMLIQGDNLEALKALLPYYAGKVKCIYIDPPYNTKSAFEHYDDNLEHSTWLSMMYPRLELLRELLAENGSIWVSIDDNEAHYLKVIMDEIFGRKNFISNVIWQKKYAPANDAIWMSDTHDHIMVFAKNKELWRPRKLPRSDRSNSAYKNPDDDPRGPWKAGDYTCAKNAEERPNLYYPITNPNTGEEIWPKKTRVWAYGLEQYREHVENDLIWWGKSGKNKVPAFKRHLSTVVDDGVVPMTVWLWGDVGHTQDGRKEQLKLINESPFSNPKPERLIEQILRIASDKSDIVLDSFLGSGTTAAVAHKMGRHYIGIETGKHAVSHCVPRLKKVIDGEQGGISEAVAWKGGGGFHFYQLGKAVFDEEGTINPKVRFGALAAHVWFSETGQALGKQARRPFLGIHDGIAYALLYNGILGDKSVSGGNVLIRPILKLLREQAKGFDGPWVIYGESSRLSKQTLLTEQVTFKQTPYDIRIR